MLKHLKESIASELIVFEGKQVPPIAALAPQPLAAQVGTVATASPRESRSVQPWRLVEASFTAGHCKNYIRDIVDNLQLQPNPEKPVIALSIGDPTTYGNLNPPNEAVQAVIEVLQGGEHNGYAPCVGYEHSRQAVAKYLSTSSVTYDHKDIILCSGCSSSLDISVTALCDAFKDQAILLPRPGFPLYRTLAESMGVPIRYYSLLPDRNWEVDLQTLECQMADGGCCAVVINNPSNPCGSVYSEQHLNDILTICQQYQVPVISDEVYERIVYKGSGKKFISLASLKRRVPILVCGGLAKRFLAPGWRMGWIAIYDPERVFDHQIRAALASLSQRIIGSNTLIQGALPAILERTPDSFHDHLLHVLERNANMAFDMLSNAKGLQPVLPEGAMYMMVHINLERFPKFKNGLNFVVELMQEESVFCLPGDCFQIPGFVRIVLTCPEQLLREACSRIMQFCERHYVKQFT